MSSFKTQKQCLAREWATSGCPEAEPSGRLAPGLDRKNAAGPCSRVSREGQRDAGPPRPPHSAGSGPGRSLLEGSLPWEGLSQSSSAGQRGKKIRVQSQIRRGWGDYPDNTGEPASRVLNQSAQEQEEQICRNKWDTRVGLINKSLYQETSERRIYLRGRQAAHEDKNY